MASKHIKFAPPRPLAETEDTHSLSRWKTNFKNYCMKDPDYVYFLKSTTVWRSDQRNYGFTENVGDKTPTELEEHVKDFLHLLASYLPHGFLTDKLIKKSKSLESAFMIIKEHYGLLPSQLLRLPTHTMLRGNPQHKLTFTVISDSLDFSTTTRFI